MSIRMKKNKHNDDFRPAYRFSRLIFILLTGAVLLPAWADEETESFTFSSNSTAISFSEGDQQTILSGNARIQSEDLIIKAGTIELYGEEFRYARCREDVQVENKVQQISLSTEALFYDRRAKFVRIRNYAEMVDLKNELVIKCGYLEYFDETEVSIFQIGVRILKSTEDSQMVCRSDFARYDRKEETLQLTGDPVVYWKGDRYSAVSILINLDTDEISLEGNVEGEFTAEDEEQE